MELSSDFVGTTLKEQTFTVTARWTMNCAAAISDANPLYLDDERPGGIIAPPLFPVALTWQVIEKYPELIEASAFPKEIIFTQVHYTEHIRYNRPIQPGDRLVITGTIAAILPHRAGTHIVTRFAAADDRGAPVFTEHIGAMMRGVRCADSGRGSDDIPAVPRLSGDVPVIRESSLLIDPLAPYLYDGCTNIHFPIHTSLKFARQVGLPGTILQGTATLALAVREVLAWEADADPRRMDSLSCRFTGMVLPGSTIRVLLTGKKDTPGGTDLFFSVVNDQGARAISDGYIRLKS